MSKIMVKQVLTKEQIKDIQAIVEYSWADEEKHYEGEWGEDVEKHIFEVLKRLKQMYTSLNDTLAGSIFSEDNS